MAGSIEALLSGSEALVLVEVAEARGSTPREKGAFMLVAAGAVAGTIGGGHLEYMAIDHARALLSSRTQELRLDIPLGPEIGQCCGGRVTIVFTPVDDGIRQQLRHRIDEDLSARPSVFLFGAGHVGKAMARALVALPFNVTVVESRQEELEGLPDGVSARLSAMPESIVGAIPPGSAVVILTHDHALDFLIAAEALKRSDLAYVGMIGSATKKVTFRNWLAREVKAADFARLTLPIGGPLKDKRPEIIAALTAAEIITALEKASAKSTTRTTA